MLEDLDPSGLFQELRFFTLGIILCAGRVADYQYTSAGKYFAKGFKMFLLISERMALILFRTGFQNLAPDPGIVDEGRKRVRSMGRTLYGR